MVEGTLRACTPIVAAISASLLLVACVEEANTDSISQRATAPLTATYHVDFAFPGTPDPGDVGLAAGSGGLRLNDGVSFGTEQIIPGYWSPQAGDQTTYVETYFTGSSVRHAGGIATSMGATELGVGAVVPALISRGPVTLRNRARVAHLQSGEILSQVQDGATYGELEDNVEQLRTDEVLRRWDFEFVSARIQDGTVVNSQDTVELSAPTSLTERGLVIGAITVNSGGTLVLHPGTYAIDSLTVNNGASLVIDNLRGEVKILVGRAGGSFWWPLILRGEVIRTDLNKYNFLIGYLGKDNVPVGTSLGGTLVAPFASVEMAALPAYRGAYYGKSLTVHQNSVVRQREFEWWLSRSPADPGLTQCEGRPLQGPGSRSEPVETVGMA